MSEFPKSSPQLDALIAGAHDFETIKQLARHQMEREGRVVLDGDLGAVGLPGSVQPTEAPVLPANSRLGTGRAARVFYPAGDMRMEIFAESEQELDEIESRIRRALGSR